MKVTDRNCERIGNVEFGGERFYLEERLYHELDLLFRCIAAANDRFLYLAR